VINYVVSYAFTVDTPLDRKLVPLILKKQPEHLKGMLNLPGGKLMDDESPIDGAIRELKEETGLDEVQEVDPMVYYPAEYMGVIHGSTCNIHCVKVPVCSGKLNPGPNEMETVDWYELPQLYSLPNLMPNLRIVIPLMEIGIKDWTVVDTGGDWRHSDKHTVGLTFKGLKEWNPLAVTVRSVLYYE